MKLILTWFTNFILFKYDFRLKMSGYKIAFLKISPERNHCKLIKMTQMKYLLTAYKCDNAQCKYVSIACKPINLYTNIM